MLRPMTRFAFSAAEALPGDVPTQVEVLHTGKFNHPAYGDFEITGADLDELVHEFSHDKEALIDVDHKASKGDTRAAGWVKGLSRVGDTLVAAVDWTKHGSGLVQSREYTRISAEYGPRRDLQSGKALPGKHLKAITITNRPFLKGLKPITLSDGADEVFLDSMPSCDEHERYDEDCPDCKKLLSDSGGTQDPSGPTREPALEAGANGSMLNNGDSQDMTDKIRSVLKLADDAPMDDVIAAIETALSHSERSDVVALADFEAVKKLAEDATKSAQESAKALSDFQADTYLSEQIREGRLAPSELDDYRALMAAAPDLTRKAIEARPKNTLLSTIGSGGDDSSDKVGDVTATGKDEHRSGLDQAARKLMAVDSTLDYGEALIAAEKAAG